MIVNVALHIRRAILRGDDDTTEVSDGIRKPKCRNKMTASYREVSTTERKRWQGRGSAMQCVKVSERPKEGERESLAAP